MEISSQQELFPGSASSVFGGKHKEKMDIDNRGKNLAFMASC